MLGTQENITTYQVATPLTLPPPSHTHTTCTHTLTHHMHMHSLTDPLQKQTVS